MDKSNPYSAPIDVADDSSSPDVVPLKYKQTTFANALLRWTPICIVAAAPSFVYGCMVVEGKPAGIIAMLVGVTIAALLYAWMDIQPFWRRWMSRPNTRQSIIAVFSVRVIVSIIFPVGGMNDAMFGILSVSTVSALTGQHLNMGGRLGPVLALVTTILQGVVLTAELFVLALAFIGFLRLVQRFRNRPQTK